MATNKKALIDFSVKRVKPIKEFIFKEKLEGNEVIVGDKISHGKFYYKCKNPKFVETI